MKLKNLQGRENMKKIFTLYKRDIHSIITNIMSIVLIGGLIFLPSLYAWLNIKASWDPYAQTDQIPLGFVNEDVGATVRGEEIDVGKNLVDNLKKIRILIGILSIGKKRWKNLNMEIIMQ